MIFTQFPRELDELVKANPEKTKGQLLRKATNWKPSYIQDILYRLCQEANISPRDIVEKGTGIVADWLCCLDTQQMYMLRVLSLVPCPWRNVVLPEEVPQTDTQVDS